MNDIKIGMLSLFGLFVLGTLEFLGWRQPIRDGLATVRGAVVVFAGEVRGLWRWMTNPAPIGDEEDWREVYEVEQAPEVKVSRRPRRKRKPPK